MSGELGIAPVRVQAQVVTEEYVKVMEIEREVFPYLDAEQSERLHSALVRVLIPPPPSKDNEGFIREFIAAKGIQGCSPRTCEYYAHELVRAAKIVGKPFGRWSSDDVRQYMAGCMSNGCNETTANNKYRVLSTFFMWMEGEEYVDRSVMRKVSQVKVPRRRRRPFSQNDIEMMREACSGDRDRAIVEVLLSSGMRASELVGLRKSDVDIERRRAVVIGKGNKEREVYFSEVAQMYTRRYLAQRDDDEPWLFVSKTRRLGSYQKLSVSGLESFIRGLGRKAGVDKAHPHRFRHTMATEALKRGMPIEEIKTLLGHDKIETTLVYAEIDHENVMNNARRLIG